MDYLDVQETIKKEMAIRKEELKEELKAKGIKYNPRIHKFNEITPDQSILKIEDKTGNLVIHIPHKSVKIELEDDEGNNSGSEDKMNIASSPTLSVSSVFSSSSSLSTLTDLTEFEDVIEGDQIILDNIYNSHNLQEILAKGEDEIRKNEINQKNIVESLPSLDIPEERLAMEKLSVSEPSDEEISTEKEKQIQSSNESLSSQKTEIDTESSLSTKAEKELTKEESGKGMTIKITNNIIKLNLGKKKTESSRTNIKSIKLKLNTSKSEEKENEVDYMDIEKSNYPPIIYSLRSRTNSSESLSEKMKTPTSITSKKGATMTSKKQSKSAKNTKTSRSKRKTVTTTTRTTTNSKKESTYFRNKLKVGKKNVTAISTVPKKNNKITSKRNILDEKSVNSVPLGKRLRIKK